MKRINLFLAVVISLLIIVQMPMEAKNKRVIMLALDGVSVEGFKQADTPNLDKLLAKGALSMTTRANRDKPTVMFLYTGHTDSAGHSHKWMSSDYLKAIEEADEQIGIFLNKLKQEGLFDDTYFMLLSDHGGFGYEHGGMTVDEMIVPWGIVGPRIKKGFEIKEPNNTVNTASVILKLFNVKQPLCWTGEVPMSIFKYGI